MTSLQAGRLSLFLLQEAEDLDSHIFFSLISEIQRGKGPFDADACFLTSNVIPHRLLHLPVETHAVQPATGGMKTVIISKLKPKSGFILFTLSKKKKRTFFFRFQFMKVDFSKCHTRTLIVVLMFQCAGLINSNPCQQKHCKTNYCTFTGKRGIPPKER